VGPRAGLDAGARRKILCPCRGSNPGRPARSQTLYCLSYRGSNKLIVAQLIKKFHAIYGTRKFITGFTKAHHVLILNQVNPLRARPHYFFWINFNINTTKIIYVNSAQYIHGSTALFTTDFITICVLGLVKFETTVLCRQ
jgi:hypothetical protein